MKRLRLILRDAWGRLLRVVPLHRFDGLRHSFQSGDPASMTGRCHAALLRALRYRPLDDGPPAFVIQEGSRLQLINDGSIISRCLYWLGHEGYEPAVARWWSRCCARATGILEIGCNIGYMTVRGAAAAAPGVAYTAAEPNPEALRSLRKNLALNHLDNVRVIEAAIVGRATRPTMSFCISMLDTYTAPTGSHLAGKAPPSIYERVIEVPVVEARGLLAGVDTLKLDVEGAELDILASIEDILARQRVLFFVEVLDDAQDLRQFLAEFARSNQYQLRVIGSSLIEVSPQDLLHLELWRTHRSRDLLVVPRELGSLLEV